ncbi:hypothetical protein AVEN_159417-1 [Araneus ventricosus]|uniref:Uncharacterized protein n=1 Tax=Araneus ventricosus TaxID=182803 RepID=A0A4Y2A203_ARAVE|nr:hypothetical protein AVEN_159417-1 [Araneus ventricosus]
MYKAGHSYLLQNGNFRTREGTSNHQGQKPMEKSIAAGKTWISNQAKFQAFLRRFFRRGTYSRAAADQSFCLEWDLASRLPNQNSAEWGGNRGD